MIEQERKVRKDKKVDIKPTISVDLKECIYRLSYITNKPVKDVALHICNYALHSKEIMEILSESFRRNLTIHNTLYMGDLNRTSLAKVRKKEDYPKERISLRVSKTTYENICKLNYALDVTPTMATAILLETCLLYSDYVNENARSYLEQNLDLKRIKELEKVIKYVNEHNPYEEEVSWGALLSFLMDEIKTGTTNVAQLINDWLDSYKKLK
ncbi:hypothetical protein [Bacillus cereus]|uniref:hypothetical protein n=1 Tax=Bacillus cereus TaxID=1396 RepID=UPI000BEBD2E7|nr:hypothetical protein [Bacillus cereus]PDY57570.1 hypothetical protein COM88_30640 [Bacillus cereus]PGQ84730.1 hypothetical protein COA26_12265 [Bacillus cereus]